jgi:hypothetical protein
MMSNATFAGGTRSLCYGDPRFSAQQPTPGSTQHLSASKYESLGYIMIGHGAHMSVRDGSQSSPSKAKSIDGSHGEVQKAPHPIFRTSTAEDGEPSTELKRYGMPTRAIRVDGSIVKMPPVQLSPAAKGGRSIKSAPSSENSPGGISERQTTETGRPPPGSARTAQHQTYKVHVRTVAPVGEGITQAAVEGAEDEFLELSRFKQRPQSDRLDHLGNPKRATSGLISRGSHGGMCNLWIPHRAEAAPRAYAPQCAGESPQPISAPVNDYISFRRLAFTPTPQKREAKVIRRGDVEIPLPFV